MTNPAAIAGSFAKIVPVPSRNVVQIIVEIESEAADAALKALGGFPIPGSEKPVAVAQLTKTPEKPVLTPEASAKGVAKQERKPWGELLPSQQAGILCDDPEFQKWVYRQLNWVWHEESTVAANNTKTWVRTNCNVISRRDITAGSEAERVWKGITERFMRDTGRMAEKTI